MKNKILSLIIAVCVFVLPLTVISFAAAEETAILNNVFFVDTKEDTNISCYVSEEGVSEITYELMPEYDEYEEDIFDMTYQYIYISIFENTTGIDDVAKAQVELDDIFKYVDENYLFLFGAIEFDSEVSEINGYKCIKYSAVEDDMFYYTLYVCATEENVYCFTTETDDNNSAFIKNAVATFTVNGTLLEGDSHKNEIDFTDAPDYRTQAEEYVLNFSDFDVFDEETNSIARVGIFIMMLPFIILVIVTIVVIYKHSKNKKILEQYEKTFGVMGMGMQPYMNNTMNYGAPMNNSYFPNQPMQQPQQPFNQNYQAPTDDNGQNNNF